MDKHNLRVFSPEKTLIAPSILAADFSDLGQQIRDAEDAGADLFHIDIMDGHFVPNLSMGPPVVKAIRPITALPFDVHLMLSRPADYVRPFIDAGADHITIHVESDGDLTATLSAIREQGCSCGISMRPGTDVQDLKPYLELVDLVLIMTVEPGFGGQAFMTEVLPKIRTVRTWLDEIESPVHLEVDGGINPDTAVRSTAAGVNILVAGTTIFRDPAGIKKAIDKLRGQTEY